MKDTKGTLVPDTARNWEGNQEPIKWPKKFTILAAVDDVYLLKTSKDVFAVVYGLEVVPNLTRTGAAIEFGNCIMHQAGCEGLLN